MKTIGQLVQETLDSSDKKLHEIAFINVCEAIEQTAQKIFGNESLPEPAFQRFISRNWRLISFMGISDGAVLPLDLPFRLRRAVSSFNSPRITEEIVTFAVRQTLLTRRLPLEISFNETTMFIVENDKLLFPKSLLFALVGSVVLHPANKNELLPDKYWLSIWDFKMFISELWGRADLAERVMKIYSKS